MTENIIARCQKEYYKQSVEIKLRFGYIFSTTALFKLRNPFIWLRNSPEHDKCPGHTLDNKTISR